MQEVAILGKGRKIPVQVCREEPDFPLERTPTLHAFIPKRVLAVWIDNVGELPRPNAFTHPWSHDEVARIDSQLPEVCPNQVCDDIVANYTSNASGMTKDRQHR